MKPNKLREFCEKNKGKKIRVVLEPTDNWENDTDYFVVWHAPFLAREISSLTVEADDGED